MFSLQQNQNKRAEQVLPEVWEWGEGTQIMYTHVRKYKNDKNKIKIK
jgi:hypothetical protein